MDLLNRLPGLRSALGVACCLLGLLGHSVLPYVLRGSNNKPIIGILAQETDFKSFKKFGSSYIAASYVKFIESAGARVIPVRLYLTDKEYDRIFNSINGILYPGGDVSLESSEFSRVARIFYNKAIEAYDKGDYFPVWGTCLGLQLLSYLTCGENLLTWTNTEGYSLSVDFTKDAEISRMFRRFPEGLMQVLATEPVTSNFHYWSLSVQNFTNNEILLDFYRILTTNFHNGIKFISTMEGVGTLHMSCKALQMDEMGLMIKSLPYIGHNTQTQFLARYPIYGVQWHPEKNPYEWKKPEGIPHSRSAMAVSYYTADFFVSEARKSFHSFATKEEEIRSLIYNLNPLYTGTFSSFEQAYFFD